MPGAIIIIAILIKVLALALLQSFAKFPYELLPVFKQVNSFAFKPVIQPLPSINILVFIIVHSIPVSLIAL
jgi:hypothetical protein